MKIKIEFDYRLQHGRQRAYWAHAYVNNKHYAKGAASYDEAKAALIEELKSWVTTDEKRDPEEIEI